MLLGLVPWTFPSTGDEDREDVMPMTKVMMKVLRVSYCSADLTYDHVFAFIVTNRNFSLSKSAEDGSLFRGPLRIAITIAGMESWNAKRVFNIN